MNIENRQLSFEESTFQPSECDIVIDERRSFLGQLSAHLLLIAYAPIAAVNALCACLLGQAVFARTLTRDAFGRSEIVLSFTCGLLKNVPALLLVATGKAVWVGLPRDLNKALDDAALWNASEESKAGLFSLHGLRVLTGIPSDPAQSLIEQASLNRVSRVALVARSLLATVIYGVQQVEDVNQFDLFGVRIDNDTMTQAVDKVMSERADGQVKTACFVNVNSFNLAREHRDLTDHINSADLVFADGSGVRLAARSAGFQLKDNVNGTDLLPVLCDAAARAGKSLFLLGAEPGVAEQTRQNLCEQHEGLNIAGTYHGYFDKAQSDMVIERINQSGADILLVAFGSPIQEKWIAEHRAMLNVQSALAVGGLFDFYSGRIPRSPIWMRELGLEWVYRLMQEPRKKFQRYVIGNPQFLIRCWTQLKPQQV